MKPNPLTGLLVTVLALSVPHAVGQTLDYSTYFDRAGGPIAVDAEQEIVVRAHMSTTGYGGSVLRGSVGGGFRSDRLAEDFAVDVERRDPQPPPCAF